MGYRTFLFICRESPYIKRFSECGGAKVLNARIFLFYRKRAADFCFAPPYGKNQKVDRFIKRLQRRKGTHQIFLSALCAHQVQRTAYPQPSGSCPGKWLAFKKYNIRDVKTEMSIQAGVHHSVKTSRPRPENTAFYRQLPANNTES